MNENKAFIGVIATEIGDSHVCCKKCQKMAVHYEASNHQGYGLNECLIFQCTPSCQSKGWAYCKVCKKHFGMSNEKQHPASRAHKKHKSELVVSGLIVIISPQKAQI